MRLHGASKRYFASNHFKVGEMVQNEDDNDAHLSSEIMLLKPRGTSASPYSHIRSPMAVGGFLSVLLWLRCATDR